MFALKLLFKWKCIFGGAICKKCKNYGTGKHSCCIDLVNENVENSPVKTQSAGGKSYEGGCPKNEKILKNVEDGPPGSAWPCCCTCCIKVPLIKLRCNEENIVIAPSIFPTPMASGICNETFVVPFCCTQNCGGPQTAVIKDWVSCIMEPIAVWLKMLKFDFYNDWTSGSLYFPLIKRKYKVKSSNKRFGQIKKDKFCDFDCIVRDWSTPTPVDTIIPGPMIDGVQYPGYPPILLPWKNKPYFQGPPYYDVHRVKIKRNLFTKPIVVDQRIGSLTFGCRSQFRSSLTTDWVGTLFTNETENLNNAASTVILKGNDNEGNGCQITFSGPNAYQELFDMIDPHPQLKINEKVKWFTEQVSTRHGKPEYVKTDDPLSGVKTWVNIGGHGHHKNICNNTRLVERGEYFKNSLDCLTPETIVDSTAPLEAPDTGDLADGVTGSPACASGLGGLFVCPAPESSCGTANNPSTCCAAACGANGVRACNIFCPCRLASVIGPTITAYVKNIYHGMVVMGTKDSDLYYTVSMKPGDPYYNSEEYKANLFYPVSITELGSSTYCDIDEAPFIMDQLVPTTFNVSMEGLKYRLGDQTVSENPPGNYNSNIPIKKIEDKDGTLNLRAYVEFSCLATVCLNVMGTVNHSQIGVEMIDKNDMGIEIGNCWTRFDHDIDIREYFCKRFSSYKNDQLDVWYQKPGSQKFENNYGPYAEIRLHEGYNLTYQLPPEDGSTGAGVKVPSEYLDGEFFVPGDACGYIRSNDNTPSAINNPSSPAGTDYFYGLAPGVTSVLTDFPGNPVNINLPNNPLHQGIFGDYTDVINYIKIDGINLTVQDEEYSGSDQIYAIKFNRSQTPYFFYFGLIPGKTSLHKTVGKFFADKINAVTLQGVKPGAPTENQFNKPNINNPVKNLYTIYKTCLGEVELPIAGGGYTPSGQTIAFENIVTCDLSINPVINEVIPESTLGAGDGSITVEATAPTSGTFFPPLTWTWQALNNSSNTPSTQETGPDGSISESMDPLSPDTYLISVQDNEGCTASISISLGQGAPNCCQTTRLIKATIPSGPLPYGAQFCWSPCADIAMDGSIDPIFPTGPWYGTHPKCGPYAEISFGDLGHLACGDTPSWINASSYPAYNFAPTSAMCATYPDAFIPTFPDEPNIYPREFYLCTCEDIRDINGLPWDDTNSNLSGLNIEFTSVVDGDSCDNDETRLPEIIPGEDGPCVGIIESNNPESYVSIDDINDMGTLKDSFGDPVIDKPAKVMRLIVEVPAAGGTYPGGNCPCPTTVYFNVYGGTMNLDTLEQPGALADWNTLTPYAGTIFNGGMPCVRAMVRVMKPGYDVKNYDTDRTVISYPNILVQTGFPTSTKQKAIDYSQQEWYDTFDDPWDGQPVGYEPDTFLWDGFGLDPIGFGTGVTVTTDFNGNPFGTFSGATPPEIATYSKFSTGSGNLMAGSFVDIAPDPCGTGGFDCRSFRINSGTFIQGYFDLNDNLGVPYVQTYWMPYTTDPNGGDWWLSDQGSWRQYKPHENPNNTGQAQILSTGDYVVNVGSGWLPNNFGTILSTGCNSAFYGRCCNTTLTKMTWRPDTTITSQDETRLNPAGEGIIVNGVIGNSNNPTQDLNNSLLYDGQNFGGTTDLISTVDHPWLHVNSKYDPNNLGIEGVTGELTINLYKPGTYIIETALFQYQNGEFKDGAGYGSEDCFAELYSILG